MQELFQSSKDSLFPEWKSLGAGGGVVPAMQSSSSPPSTVSSSFSPINSIKFKSVALKSTHFTFLNKLPRPTTSDILLFLNRPATSAPITSKVDHKTKESRKDPFFREKIPSNLLSSAVESAVVFLASVAISATVLGADVGPANASVVTNSRKLHGEELATVKLFQENTPSVVYITNLASRQDAFTLGVLEVPQKSGSGFVWDKDGHVVTNYHVIRGASDLRRSTATHCSFDQELQSRNSIREFPNKASDVGMIQLSSISTQRDLFCRSKSILANNNLIWIAVKIRSDFQSIICSQTLTPGGNNLI